MVRCEHRAARATHHFEWTRAGTRDAVVDAKQALEPLPTRFGGGWSAVTRRDVLKAGAGTTVGGVALGACSRPTSAPSAEVLVSPRRGVGLGRPPRVELYALVPTLAKAFNASHRGIRISVSGKNQGYRSAHYGLVSLGNGGGMTIDYGSLLPLNAALAALNFNPNTIVPGAMEAYRYGSAQVGLPVAQAPIGIRWRRDVFRAAGLAAPTPDWTINDFVAACVEIKTMIPTGRVRGLDGVLPPLGMYGAKLKNGTFASFSGALAEPAWWIAFALGYGGDLVTRGRVRLNGAAIRGLARLVDIARQFGDTTVVYAQTAPMADTFPLKYAMMFDVWASARGVDVALTTPMYPPPGPVLTFGKNWAWARLPRFPLRAEITTVLDGEGLQPSAHAVYHESSLHTAVQSLVWLNRAQARPSLDAAGVPPVVTSTKVQKDFWSRQAPDDRQVGEWSQFVPYASALPLPTGIASEMWSPLLRAIARPASLPGLVREAEHRMNAAIAAQGG